MRHFLKFKKNYPFILTWLSALNGLAIALALCRQSAFLSLNLSFFLYECNFRLKLRQGLNFGKDRKRIKTSELVEYIVDLVFVGQACPTDKPIWFHSNILLLWIGQEKIRVVCRFSILNLQIFFYFVSNFISCPSCKPYCCSSKTIRQCRELVTFYNFLEHITTNSSLFGNTCSLIICNAFFYY